MLTATKQPDGSWRCYGFTGITRRRGGAAQRRAALPELEPGQEASVTVEGRWSADAITRAADVLGDAGWRRVDVRPSRDGGAVCALLQMPEVKR